MTKPFKIGIIREDKIPPDNRVPLTPRQCSEMEELYSQVDIKVQWSAVRCFSDEDYKKFSVKVQESVAECQLLLGIKEALPGMLLPHKAYMFFSHTIKEQPQNRGLLQAALAKKITLMDYELLTDAQGHRLIGFGRWAGIVGAHYALLMLGEKTGKFSLRPANKCVNLQEVIDQYDNIRFPPARFVITGGGRVASGAKETMEDAGIPQVNKKQFLNRRFDTPVYVQLHSDDLYINPQTGSFNKEEFYKHPEKYVSDFEKYIPYTDVLINCMYWDPRAPRLFTEESTRQKDFSIRIIADISCDVNGSIPITHRITSISDPVFGYHKSTGKIGKPYQKDTIDVMAVPNLPNELPRDSSRDFGLVLMNTILPAYFQNPQAEIFERATIAHNGKLMPRYDYLSNWVIG